MLDRWHLGRLLSSEKTRNGVMGQTMFVSSTAGNWVLKGNPIYPGQFQEEKYFVDHLHRHTKLPVPFPYLVDASDDIFGWCYALMPRLPGIHLTTGQADSIKIGELLAETLVDLHTWKVHQYGELDPENHVIRPFQSSYQSWLYRTIRYWLEDAKKYSVITSNDTKWVEDLLENSKSTFERLDSPAYVMGDFKPENFLLQKHKSGWAVSGLFDFTQSYFGDPIADLPKMTLFYLSTGEKELARTFLSTYFRSSDMDKETFLKRFKVHMLHRCVLDWGCAWATETITWDSALSFSEWGSGFIEASAECIK